MPPGRKTPYTLKAKENGTGFALAPRKDERLKLEAGRDDYSKEAQKFYGNYNLWRLMIDKKYQNRGYGKQAVELALKFIRTFPCGKADYCWLSYEPENAAAKSLYASFGFIETGEKDGEEQIAVLKL